MHYFIMYDYIIDIYLFGCNNCVNLYVLNYINNN